MKTGLKIKKTATAYTVICAAFLWIFALYRLVRRVPFERGKEARLVGGQNTNFMCQNVCQNLTKMCTKRKNK